MIAALPFFPTEFQSIALLVSERVMACLIAGTVLTAGAGFALRVMQRQTARTKFAICFATLAGIAVVPVLGWRHAQDVVTSPSSPVPILRLPEDWAIYICAIWAIGAAIALGRLAFGLYRVQQVRSSCVPVTSTDINIDLQAALDQFQAERTVQLCTSELVRVPTAIGFWRPAVALPAWCLSDLSPSELHSVVLHELEHLRRYDDWTNLFQRVVGAVFFFHPAIWWLESRLSLEREVACDDAVLAVVPDPKSYARCLVSLAEKSYVRRGMALAQAAVSRVQQLTARVTQILDPRRPSSTALWKPALSIAVITLFAGSASLEMAPRLVAFQSDASQGARGANTAPRSAVDTASLTPAKLVDSSADRSQLAFALRPTPARWLEPAESEKRTPKVVGKRARASNGIAENSSTHMTAATQGTIAPERTVLSAAQNFAPAHTALRAAQASPQQNSQSATPSQAPSAQMLVMVVHSEERDESGMIFWSVRVVRWMVFHPQTQDRVVDPQVPAKT